MREQPTPTLGRGGLVGRWLRSLSARCRARERDERGELVAETVFAMALIPMILLAYVAANLSTNRVEIETRFYAEAGQVAQGVFEEARARPWPCLGFNPAVDAGTSTVDSEMGQIGHTVPTTCAADQHLSPVSDIVFKGTTFHVLTDIVWVSTATPGKGDAYGVKQTNVTITWGDPKSDATLTRTMSEQRRSTPAEAPVPGVADPDTDAPSL